MYQYHTIAAVIPAYNEAALIVKTVASVPAFVDRIIVIDDGSIDDTSRVIAALGDDRIELIRHRNNLGVGAATISGYRAAARLKIDIIVVMDGDGQMHPGDLTRLLDAILLDEVDYVRGNRFLHESISTMPPLRFIGNRILSALTRYAAGIERSFDAQCGYSAIRREALTQLDLNSLYPRYGFLNELLFNLVLLNIKIGSVPVRTIYGAEISDINPFTTVPTILFLIARGYLRRIYRSKIIGETSLALSRHIE